MLFCSENKPGDQELGELVTSHREQKEKDMLDPLWIENQILNRNFTLVEVRARLY